ncbi:MAG: DUF86 domain-containing protein [Planctomycetes bacterium]|nr:DUF86 domain-containing protein [Planctomycetota bacterium]
MEKRLFVERKVAVVRDNLEKLRHLAALDEAAFLSDFTKADSAQHRLQTSIQALVDLGALVAAEKGIPAGGRSTDLIDALHRAGVFPADRRDIYLRMVRFRNVLVHLYNGVNIGKVYEVLRSSLGDIERFLDDLLAGLGDLGKSGAAGTP